LDLTPRQFFNGVMGSNERDRDINKSQFYLHQYNAATVGSAFAGNDFAKAVYKQRPPWEEIKKTGISGSKIKAAFGAVSKEHNKD
jgi:hypothetical protein